MFFGIEHNIPVSELRAVALGCLHIQWNRASVSGFGLIAHSHSIPQSILCENDGSMDFCFPDNGSHVVRTYTYILGTRGQCSTTTVGSLYCRLDQAFMAQVPIFRHFQSGSLAPSHSLDFFRQVDYAYPYLVGQIPNSLIDHDLQGVGVPDLRSLDTYSHGLCLTVAGILST